MTRQHMLVLPGGGYQFLAEHEGEPVAQWVRELGLEASVFDYPVETRHPGPVDAVRAEVSRLRAAGIDRVGLLGFSAGGHLAGHAALSGGGSGRPDAAILCYPVVSMVTATHGGSRSRLVGPHASAQLCRQASLELLVTADSPKFFIWHTATDETVPVEHSYLLGRALAASKVDHELHVFPHGEHGLGLAADSGAASQWTTLCAAWLEADGWISGN